MDTTTIVQTGVGTTRWWNPNWHLTPFSVNATTTVGGSATYNLETTQDNYWTPGQPAPTVTAVSTAQTTTQGVTLTAAVTGVRVNITAGSGSVTLRATQAGIVNGP
jgi:hypothetical protein